MFVLFLPCLSRYDVHDDDDHDDNGVTLSWYPGVMKDNGRTMTMTMSRRVVDCFTFYADGYFYHIRFLLPPFAALLCL